MRSPKPLFQGKGLTQAVNEGQELGGVQVKDRHGLALETVTGVVATQYQQVEQAVSMALKELAFSHVPVLVLEGKMDQGGNAHGLDIKPQGGGSERGMSSGIVSDGQGLDPTIFFGLFGKTEDAFQSFATGATTRHQLKGDGEFLALEEGGPESISCLRGGHGGNHLKGYEMSCRDLFLLAHSLGQ